MDSGTGRIAVLTGGNRGIGREVVRQLGQRGFSLILGSRAADLAGDGLPVRAHRLDVTDTGTIETLRPGDARPAQGWWSWPGWSFAGSACLEQQGLVGGKSPAPLRSAGRCRAR